MRVIGLAGWSGAGETTLPTRSIPIASPSDFGFPSSSTPVTTSMSRTFWRKATR
jgi:hypothetical protein